MKLGLCRGKVVVEPHDSEWEINAQQTITMLKKILGTLILDAQHIGSTSIRSICAKPIIDIVVGVSSFHVLPEMIQLLENNGFIYRGQDQPDQYLFICGDNWHGGVMGIIAGRLKDKYNRPSCVATKIDGVINGSGRSVSNVDLGRIIHEALALGIVTEGGGHAAAAGF